MGILGPFCVSNLPTGIRVGLVWLAVANPTEAQDLLRYGGNLTFAARREWRGITRRDGPVMQPEVFASYGRDNWLAIGAGTIFELRGDRAAPTYLGSGRRSFGEVDFWAEASVSTVPFRLSAGWVYRIWNVGKNVRWVQPARNSLRLETFDGTQELFLRVAAPGLGRFVPQVTVFKDVGQVDGSYLEYSFVLRVPFWAGVILPAHSILLSAKAGHSVGQHSVITDPRIPKYFEHGGITHWDLSLGTTFGEFGPIGPATFFLHPELHYQIGRDPIARTGSAGIAPKPRWWFRLGIGWSAPACRPDRRICR